ncbi:MAG: fructose-6-phosphate aldolase [Dehalococcoidia bacterium SM23_28_2]|nr:MAG: fructose-6-phosphate aldolase [Dehalococcoidia bacterium SM23_28_2]
MRLFLDTASVDEIRAAAKLGVISGVTTNPTLWAKAGGGNYRDIVVEICNIIDGPISAECLSRDVEGLVKEARQVASWHPNVAVKIPIDEAGLEATSRLSKEGIKVNMTLVFSPNQALLAAQAGATFVSPFVGRLDDVGHDGMQVVADTVQVFERYHLPNQVLAASLRHPLHVIAAAKVGAHIATMPYSVLMAMLRHPLTDVGIERFLADAKKAAKAARGTGKA